MTYNLIEQLLSYYGFERNINEFQKHITIQTPGQTMIMNGRRIDIPGKVGNIDLSIIIFDDCGELINDTINNIPCVYCKALFKGVEFLNRHILYPEEDAVFEIKNFLKIFNII